jgi:hypothetical protein
VDASEGPDNMTERGGARRTDHLSAVPDPKARPAADAADLLLATARGDEAAFCRLYDLVAPARSCSRRRPGPRPGRWSRSAAR